MGRIVAEGGALAVPPALINTNFKEDDASRKWEGSSSLKFVLIKANRARKVRPDA
jgi:hypothetical protein